MRTNLTGSIPAFGEVYVTGVRNPYRVSFDRANSDMYWGDVGENAYEEVDFLKAGSNVLGPPVDYGWPQLEATHNSTVPGAPHTTTNPFTGVTSLYPLREFPHTASGNGTTKPAGNGNGHAPLTGPATATESAFVREVLCAFIQKGDVPYTKQALYDATMALRGLYRATLGGSGNGQGGGDGTD